MSRRGGSRPGRQVTLLCMEQCLLASPQESTSPCYPAGAGGGSGPWTLGAAVLGFPKAEAGFGFTWCQEPALPSDPSDPGLWRLPLPQDMETGSSVTGHWMAAVGLRLLQDCPPEAWLPTGTGWHTGKGKPWPSARKGWGCSLRLLGMTATPATSSEAQVKPLDSRVLTPRLALGPLPSGNVRRGVG